MIDLKLTEDEAVDFLRNNVKMHDNLEISYARRYANCEVLNVDLSEYMVNLALKC